MGFEIFTVFTVIEKVSAADISFQEEKAPGPRKTIINFLFENRVFKFVKIAKVLSNASIKQLTGSRKDIKCFKCGPARNEQVM